MNPLCNHQCCLTRETDHCYVMHLPAYSSPRSAGLPVTRNMPFSSNSVPHRTRNMTGIYLGLDGNSKPPRSKSAIPPLARGRGMSFKVRTPAEDRRYKMVEYLRIKEEKRGFTGNALRNCKSAKISSEGPQESTSEGHVTRKRWGPGKRIDPSNLDDLIRPNPRNFTTVSNSGVTRSERLVGWMPMQYDPYTITPPDTVADDVVEEVQKLATSQDELAGLEECYKRICKGNVDSLYTLLPNRRAQQYSRRDTIGFSVRSYRNPAKAEILAEFPDPLNPGRPKTVPIQRPLVPSPYFFRHNSPQHGRAHTNQHHKPVAGQFDDTSEYLVVPRILAAPGAGGISKTLHYRISPLLGSLQLLTGKEYMSHLPPTARSADDIQGSTDAQPPLVYPSADLGDKAGEKQEEVKGKEEGQIQEKKEGRVEEKKALQSEETGEKEGDKEESKEDRDDDGEEDNEEGSNMSQVMIAGDVLAASPDGRPRPRLTTSNSGADIMLGLETDDGKSAEVEIDSLESDELQPEEIPKGRVRKTSIVEKLHKSKESELIALSIMETAGQRQREFEKLISEHQELVQEISRTPSAENIVQTETGRDP